MRTALRLAPFLCLSIVATELPAQVEAPADSLFLPGEVTFLETPPTIDGVLDQQLAKLPERPFLVLERENTELDPGPTHYRLAYGTGFLYVYIESGGDRLICRDRAYQNGDGFHMAITRALPGNEPTEEFYVLACSAVDRPSMEWTRRLFWYYNVDTIFKLTSDNTLLRAMEGNGRISFELLLPWADVRPYHPWFSDGVGFNLGFCKAVEPDGMFYHLVMPGIHIGSENQPREYKRLRFAEPAIQGPSQTFVQMTRNHITVEKDITGAAITLANADTDEYIVSMVLSGENELLNYQRVPFSANSGLSRHEFNIETSNLIPGGYRLDWRSYTNPSSGTDWLTVLPVLDGRRIDRMLASLDTSLSSVSRTTMLFRAQELQDDLNELRSYETAAKERTALAVLTDDLEELRQGRDPYAGKRGFYRMAYQSRLDDTLQPFAVRIPEDYDSSRKYPLLVFLHGSASDETNLRAMPAILPGQFIELGPRGRGPSNGWSDDQAQDDVAEAIDAVCRHFPIDRERIILMGFSMGGYGVYRTHYESPETYRALVVLSGLPSFGDIVDDEHPDFQQEKYLGSFKDTPMFVFHGDADRNCPYELTKQLVEKLEVAGARVTFHTTAGLGHEPMGDEGLAELERWLKEELR